MNTITKTLLAMMLGSATLMACDGKKAKADGHAGHGGKAAPAAVSGAESAPAEAKAQTLCPIMKSQVDKNQYVDVLGKRIYICCAGCIQAIQADPAKYIKEMEDQGIVLEKAPS